MNKLKNILLCTLVFASSSLMSQSAFDNARKAEILNVLEELKVQTKKNIDPENDLYKQIMNFESNEDVHSSLDSILLLQEEFSHYEMNSLILTLESERRNRHESENKLGKYLLIVLVIFIGWGYWFIVMKKPTDMDYY